MLNRVELIGRLGKDPVGIEKDGKTIGARFSIATTKKWKNKVGGNIVEKTEWHNISVFNQPGEFAMKYIKKGNLVYVDGEIEYAKKDDNVYANILGNTIKNLSPTAKSETATESVDLTSIVEEVMNEERL